MKIQDKEGAHWRTATSLPTNVIFSIERSDCLRYCNKQREPSLYGRTPAEVITHHAPHLRPQRSARAAVLVGTMVLQPTHTCGPIRTAAARFFCRRTIAIFLNVGWRHEPVERKVGVDTLPKCALVNTLLQCLASTSAKVRQRGSVSERWQGTHTQASRSSAHARMHVHPHAHSRAHAAVPHHAANQSLTDGTAECLQGCGNTNGTPAHESGLPRTHVLGDPPSGQRVLDDERQLVNLHCARSRCAAAATKPVITGKKQQTIARNIPQAK